MTQIAGLGMGTTNVSNTKASAGEPSKEVFEQFASIMNQNAQGYFNLKADNSAYTGVQTKNAKASDRTDASGQDYTAFRSSARRISQADRSDTAKVDTALAEKVRSLTKDVKNAVQETMDVSEEELTQAMELLGLSDIDLLQPQNLMQLVGQLTGSEDVSALLTNDGVQQLMQDVTELFADFQQQNGMSSNDFSDLLTQLSMNIDELEEQIRAQLGIADDTQVDEQPDVLTEQVMQDALHPEQKSAQTGVFSSALQQTREQTAQVQTNDQANVSQDADATVQQVTPLTEEAAAQTAGGENGSMTDSSSDTQTQTDQGFDEQMDLTDESQHVMYQDQTAPNTQSVVQTTEVPQADTMIRYESLMNQMEGLARAFASAEGTTLQMQLNPESLGRLVLTVTEKHGNVTAQITATNEQVKEALQAQMAELHATLQAQGIKVEAVEVTVATHEFEQNLDGNASANAQMQEQNDSQSGNRSNGGRRNLDQSTLEGIGGQLTEEESLAAQMMRDNGGSVDYTA